MCYTLDMVPDLPEAELRQQLLLVSALFHGCSPEDGQFSANCARVLRQALKAAALWDDSLSWALHDTESVPSIVTTWYAALIDLIQQQPDSMKLLNGMGNFDGRAAPYYTACWLTPQGREIAEKLAAHHPDWVAAITNRPT